MFSSCRDVTIASKGMQDLGLYLGKKISKTHLICALYVAVKSEDKFHYLMFGALWIQHIVYLNIKFLSHSV